MCDVALRHAASELALPLFDFFAVSIIAGIQVHRKFARRKLGTRQEISSSPVADHEIGATVTFDATGDVEFGSADSLGVLKGMIKCGVEWRVKLAQHFDAFQVAARDVVEFRLHAGGEPDIDDVREELLKHGAHGDTTLGGMEPVPFARYVIPINNSADNGGVSARPSDTKFFQCSDQVGFGEPRRRLRKFLIVVDLQKVE